MLERSPLFCLGLFELIVIGFALLALRYCCFSLSNVMILAIVVIHIRFGRRAFCWRSFCGRSVPCCTGSGVCLISGDANSVPPGTNFNLPRVFNSWFKKSLKRITLGNVFFVGKIVLFALSSPSKQFEFFTLHTFIYFSFVLLYYVYQSLDHRRIIIIIKENYNIMHARLYGYFNVHVLSAYMISRGIHSNSVAESYFNDSACRLFIL